MTQDELRVLCLEWQKTLRLQDWEVKVKFVRFHEMEPNRSGENSYVLSLKQAEVRILDPNDYQPEWVDTPDSEVDLVHELEHLHFAPFMAKFSDNPAGYTAMEQAIELNAKALVSLKRKGSGCCEG